MSQNNSDNAELYTAQANMADATIKIYLENSVGIGEHPQHIDEIDKQMQKLVDCLLYTSDAADE